MQELAITPHVGIGPILLGASRQAVRLAVVGIGFPLESSRKALDYFAQASIQVEYGDDDTVEFIGICYHRDFTVTYYGINVFDTVAPELFAAIAAREASGDSVFDPSEYVFPNQIITLWEADEQYDRIGGEERLVWAQVGVGNHRYLEAIRAIHNRNV